MRLLLCRIFDRITFRRVPTHSNVGSADWDDPVTIKLQSFDRCSTGRRTSNNS